MTKTATTVTAAEVGVKVGEFFIESWGYDQTNIDFYKVVGVSKSGKSVTVQKWSSQRVGGTQYADAVVPGEIPEMTHNWSASENESKYEPVKTKVCRLLPGYEGRPSIKVRSWGSWAYLWSGKAAYETALGYGH